MNLHSINFDFFKSESAFKGLHNKFMNNAVFVYENKYKAIFEIPPIRYFNELNEEIDFVPPEEREVDFYKDYIPEEITRISNRYLDYARRIRESYEDNPHAIYYNLNNLYEVILDEKDTLEQSLFLKQNVNIKTALFQSIQDLLQKLQPIKELEPLNESKKIKFNLRKSEISFLFYWLKEFGYLDKRLDNEILSTILQENISRQASIDKDVYLEFKDSTSEFSKIEKRKILPSKRLLKFLKDILDKYD